MYCNSSGLKCTNLACIINISSFVLSFVRSLVTTYVRILCVRAYIRTTHISQQITKRGGGMVSLPARTDPSEPLRFWHYSFCMASVLIDRYQSTTRVTSGKTINIMIAGLGTSNLTFLCPQIAAICRKTRVSLKNTTNACVYIPTYRQNIWIFPII